MSEQLKKVFNQIVEENKWGDASSLSGSGSNLERTRVIRKTLPTIIKDYQIKIMVDAPCGDFFWMKEIQKENEALLDKYFGVDIVANLMTKNQERFGSKVSSFLTRDITKEILPKADLIFTRDCLVHLSFKNIFSVLNNFKKSKSRFLLTTTFPERKSNNNIVDGEWRPINLQIAPFNFPTPIALINEESDEDGGIYHDKSLGLWAIDSLPKFSKINYFLNCIIK